MHLHSPDNVSCIQHQQHGCCSRDMRQGPEREGSLQHRQTAVGGLKKALTGS